MNLRTVFFVFFLSVLSHGFLVAQTHDHDHDHHVHDQHKYHLGVGAAGSFLNIGDGMSPGFHIHLLRQMGEHRDWGMGIGFEAIAGENLHSSLNLLFNYHPIRFLSLNAGPGLVFEKHDGSSEILPAFHTEAVFEFDAGRFHIGPMVGFGIDPEDSHFSVGVHVGFGF